MLFILLLCFSVGFADQMAPCGEPPGCLCTVPILHSIVCISNLTFFPLFPAHEKPGVLEIVLHRTWISDLFPFKEEAWPRLKYLDLRTNPLLSCDVIAKLERPGLAVYSDCPENATTDSVTTESVTTPPTESEPTWTIPLICILVFLWIDAMFFLAYCNVRRSGVYNVAQRELEAGIQEDGRYFAKKLYCPDRRPQKSDLHL